MKTSFVIGEIVIYSQNGNHTGRVLQTRNNGQNAVLIDPTDKAGMELWNAGYAVGADIHVSQVIG